MEEQENRTVRPSIKKCPYCGELLPPLTKVCPSCGQIVEDPVGDNNVTTLMSQIDDVCLKYSKISIRVIDYILLLVPIVYLVWLVVVIGKVMKSNRLYSDFLAISGRAKTLYGDNHRFSTYLSSKTTEIEELNRRNKKSHIILYVLIFIDVVCLCFSFLS